MKFWLPITAFLLLLTFAPGPAHAAKAVDKLSARLTEELAKPRAAGATLRTLLSQRGVLKWKNEFEDDPRYWQLLAAISEDSAALGYLRQARRRGIADGKTLLLLWVRLPPGSGEWREVADEAVKVGPGSAWSWYARAIALATGGDASSGKSIEAALSSGNVAQDLSLPQYYPYSLVDGYVAAGALPAGAPALPPDVWDPAAAPRWEPAWHALEQWAQQQQASLPLWEAVQLMGVRQVRSTPARPGYMTEGLRLSAAATSQIASRASLSNEARGLAALCQLHIQEVQGKLGQHPGLKPPADGSPKGWLDALLAQKAALHKLQEFVGPLQYIHYIKPEESYKMLRDNQKKLGLKVAGS